MHKSLKISLSSGFLILFSFCSSSFSQEFELQTVSNQLEKALNNNKKKIFDEFLSEGIALELSKKHERFITRFPNAKWTIQPGEKLFDNRQSLEVTVAAKKKIGDHQFDLESKQVIAITTQGMSIKSKEVVSEYSILKSTKVPLEMNLAIPNSVLTGSKYDIDIILAKPLKNGVIAAGLMPLEIRSKNSLISSKIELTPMGSGGLFKSVKAPLKPGYQKWAALIAHPDGLISITKTVRIVSKKSELIP